MITEDVRQPGLATAMNGAREEAEAAIVVRAPGTAGVTIAHDDAESPSTAAGWERTRVEAKARGRAAQGPGHGLRVFTVHRESGEGGLAVVEARTWYAARAFAALLFGEPAVARRVEHGGLDGAPAAWLVDGSEAAHRGDTKPWMPWPEAIAARKGRTSWRKAMRKPGK